MIIERIDREGAQVGRGPERRRWPERAYARELTFDFVRPGRVLLDRVARQDQDARPTEEARDELTVDDPFGC